MESSTPPQFLLRPEEAAQRLAIGRSALYGLLRSGVLPSVTINASRRIRASDLEAYVARLDAQDRPEAA
jgi:excisionase family DNA binding protein